MDIITLQEAKKANKRIGDLNLLETEHKENTVAAINEIRRISVQGKELYIVEHNEIAVETDEIREFLIPFTRKCLIKGIKVTGNELTGNFYLKLLTKPPADGGQYVYYSGIVNNILWDVPENDIPFVDESGTQSIYGILENKGTLSNFKIQIFIM